MKALILAPFSTNGLDQLRRRMDVAYEPWTESRKLWDPSELAIRLAGESIEAVVTEIDFLFDEVFEDPSPLRFIGLCRQATTQIDLEAAQARGVTVVNTPGRNANAVAELTLGLALSLVRRISEANTYVRGGSWDHPLTAYTDMRGIELAGKTMGVVGMGAVGRLVARKARALGMRVFGHDPYATGPRYVTMTPLDELLAGSHIVSLHAPETPETTGMLDDRRLAMMPRGSYLINTASAALVGQHALADALRSGRLAGAGIDVYETRPVAPNSPLLPLDNVVLTPHVGGATAETIERYSQAITRALLQFERSARARRPTAAARTA
ncbi:MAG: 3-phosphoglycerate dehydrogenase [Chloroflexota bacterium]|nr:3-phosphoglycerate dehydrogenase [Chloroflexota bacterium]MDE2969290.1 3-phosphoglycerate dehydrogenase [Chloroflexota bacterium]